MGMRVRPRKFLLITERRKAMRKLAKMEADLTREEQRLETQADEPDSGEDDEGEGN